MAPGASATWVMLLTYADYVCNVTLRAPGTLITVRRRALVLLCLTTFDHTIIGLKNSPTATTAFERNLVAALVNPRLFFFRYAELILCNQRVPLRASGIIDIQNAFLECNSILTCVKSRSTQG